MRLCSFDRLWIPAVIVSTLKSPRACQPDDPFLLRREMTTSLRVKDVVYCAAFRRLLGAMRHAEVQPFVRLHLWACLPRARAEQGDQQRRQVDQETSWVGVLAAWFSSIRDHTKSWEHPRVVKHVLEVNVQPLADITQVSFPGPRSWFACLGLEAKQVARINSRAYLVHAPVLHMATRPVRPHRAGHVGP